MQDVIPKLANVFVDKDLLEIPICFVCHRLDHLYVLLDVDRKVIVNMEPQTNVFVILDTRVTLTQDARIHNKKRVPILNVEHMLPAQCPLEFLNAFARKDSPGMVTTNASILMNVLLPSAQITPFASTHQEAMIVAVDLDT